jgi:hypothetical protein
MVTVHTLLDDAPEAQGIIEDVWQINDLMQDKSNSILWKVKFNRQRKTIERIWDFFMNDHWNWIIAKTIDRDHQCGVYSITVPDMITSNRPTVDNPISSKDAESLFDAHIARVSLASIISKDYGEYVHVMPFKISTVLCSTLRDDSHASSTLTWVARATDHEQEEDDAHANIESVQVDPKIVHSLEHIASDAYIEAFYAPSLDGKIAKLRTPWEYTGSNHLDSIMIDVQEHARAIGEDVTDLQDVIDDLSQVEGFMDNPTNTVIIESDLSKLDSIAITARKIIDSPSDWNVEEDPKTTFITSKNHLMEKLKGLHKNSHFDDLMMMRVNAAALANTDLSE